jgi:hypothetical protein
MTVGVRIGPHAGFAGRAGAPGLDRRQPDTHTRETNPGMGSGMRAVGYSRADPADANAREHLAAQREVIAAEAGRRGWELIEVFEDIAGGQSLSG